MNKLGAIVLILMGLLLVFSVFANHNVKIDSGNQVTINGGLETFREEICIDGFDNKSCTEKTYVSCNGETYKVPGPTGFVVYKKIIQEEPAAEKECSLEIFNGKEKPSPADRIKESDLEILSSRIIISIKNANWRKFIDSNSMDPFIDEGATTIEIKPKNEGEIKIGDIISYNIDDVDYALVHRVVEIGNDEEGIYFLAKGDNYFKNDPYKIRFGQIEGIVVGILY